MRTQKLVGAIGFEPATLWPRTTRARQNPRSSFGVAQQPERHDFPRLNCTELYRSSLSNSRASSESATIREVTPRRAVFFIGTGKLPLSSQKNKTARSGTRPSRTHLAFPTK